MRHATIHGVSAYPPRPWADRSTVASRAAVWTRRLIPDVRSGRVLGLLGVLVVLNLLDLGLTCLAHRNGIMHEYNPLVRSLLDNRTALIAVKLAALVQAGAILIWLRRTWQAELACWLLCGGYGALAVSWAIYYRLVWPAMA